MKIDLKRLVMYAGASGDFNEIHYNFDVARKSGFEKPIVHGMLSMALCINEAIRRKKISPSKIKKVKARFKTPILMDEEINFNLEEAEGERKIIVRCQRESGETATECEIEINEE